MAQRTALLLSSTAAAVALLSLADAVPAAAQGADELPALVVEGEAAKKTRKKSANVTDTRLLEAESAPTAEPGSPEATGGTGGAVAGGGGITGASTTVIGREQIARSPQSSLADIIAREAGVQAQSLYGGVAGARTSVDIRGFGAAASSNTLVLIDGRRLNDWDTAGFDLSTIAKESVERVEITRGNSGAVLYGDGAVGGVINIVTRGGAGLPNRLTIDGGLGSFETRQGNISASGSSGPVSAFLNGNIWESDGYRDNNRLEQQSVVGDIRWTFAQGSVYLNVGADDQKLGLPGERAVNNPFIGGGANQLALDRKGTNTPFDYGDKQGVRGTLGFTYMLAPGFELIVDGGARNKEQQAGFFREFQEQYVDTEVTTVSLTPRVNITQPLLGLPSRILTGIDYYDTDYSSTRSQFKGLPAIHVYDGNQEVVAAYWQQTVSILPTTDISAGGRIQRIETTASDTFDALAPPAFGGIEGVPLDDTETNHAWHLGIEQELTPNLTLIGRVAESFRVANIDERIGSALFGTPTNFDLRTQKSRDWEAGLRFSFSSINIQSTYYDMRLTDELHFDPVNFINRNIDPTRRRGVETIATWQVLRNLRLSGNLTYTDAEFRRGPNAGNDVPLVSPWSGNVGLSWNIIDKLLTFDTIVHYVGERRMDNDQANFQPLISSHTTVDVSLGGEIDQFFWSASVANIFDEEYFDYAVASATTYDRYNAYPLPGRTVLVKAGVNW